MINIRAIEGKYRVAYSSTRNICDEEVREELEKEEINIKLESITYWGFSIKSEHGPTGKWLGSFTVQKNYPYFASGEYEYRTLQVFQ